MPLQHQLQFRAFGWHSVAPSRFSYGQLMPRNPNPGLAMRAPERGQPFNRLSVYLPAESAPPFLGREGGWMVRSARLANPGGQDYTKDHFWRRNRRDGGGACV